MTIANIVTLIVFVLLGGLAIGLAFRVQDLQGEAATLAVEKASAEFEVARLTQHAEDLLVPLTWTWDFLGDRNVLGEDGRLRAYLVACYIEVQRALLKDDVEMTDAMVEARTHPQPRRLPVRPQVPPFLASPADVAGGIAIQGPPLTEAQVAEVKERYEGLPKHGFDVVTTRVQGAEAHHGADLAREVYRYFVRHQNALWTEVEKDAYEQAGTDATVADRWRVDPFHPAALPVGIHRIIFEGREDEDTIPRVEGR